MESVNSASRSSYIWDVDAIGLAVAQNLAVPDLISLALVSKRCRNIAYTPDLWQSRLVNAGVSHKTVDDLEFAELSPLVAFDKFKYNLADPREAVIRLFRSLGSLYYDLLESKQREPMVFSAIQDPIEQAQCLRQIKQFSLLDIGDPHHDDNIMKVNSTIGLFENAGLAEFDNAVKSGNEQKMKTFAHAIVTLNGGDSVVQSYIQQHPLLNRDMSDSASIGESFLLPESKWSLNSAKFRQYLEEVAASLNKDNPLIERVFPEGTPVLIPFCQRVLEENVMETVSSIIETADHKSPTVGYLSVVPSIYSELTRFCELIEPGKDSASSARSLPRIISAEIEDMYSLHLSSYLDKELQTFTDYAETQVTQWSQSISQQEAHADRIFLDHIGREKQKSDFLSSFKKVLAIKSIGSYGSNNSNSNNKGSTNGSSNGNGNSKSNPNDSDSTSAGGSRSGTPGPDKEGPDGTGQSSSAFETDLEAQMAMMNQKLENIRTLFSLELALDLVRADKEATERISIFSGSSEAQVHCELIFVELIRTLGDRHVKDGFSKALSTLYQYDPKQHRNIVKTETAEVSTETHSGGAVEPLAIFAELVNIGDLIQQMIHVFFEQELVQRKLVDQSDFLSPAVKAKRKFEQTLDDCVANGLNRGIDVLIDQIEFLFLTMQLGSDFDPPPGTVPDLGPTSAAQMVVTLLSSHMTLLVGSTEKTVLDVFQQEVGTRFFGAICKHIKRRTISTDGAIVLISDLNYYYKFIVGLKQRDLLPYFEALKEVGQLFLIDGSDAKALGQTLSDMSRFRGVLQAEELMEFIQRRKDWLLVKHDVEKVMYGIGIDCVIM